MKEDIHKTQIDEKKEERQKGKPIMPASKTPSKTHTQTHHNLETHTDHNPKSQIHNPSYRRAKHTHTHKPTITQPHNPETHVDHNPKSQSHNPETYTHADHNRKSQTHNQTHVDMRLWDRTERRKRTKGG